MINLHKLNKAVEAGTAEVYDHNYDLYLDTIKKLDSVSQIRTDTKRYSVSLQVGYNHSRFCSMHPVVVFNNHETDQRYSIHFGADAFYDKIFEIMGISIEGQGEYSPSKRESFGRFIGELQHLSPAEWTSAPVGFQSTTMGVFGIHYDEKGVSYSISKGTGVAEKFDTMAEAMDATHREYMEKCKQTDITK